MLPPRDIEGKPCEKGLARVRAGREAVCRRNGCLGWGRTRPEGRTDDEDGGRSRSAPTYASRIDIPSIYRLAPGKHPRLSRVTEPWEKITPFYLFVIHTQTRIHAHRHIVLFSSLLVDLAGAPNASCSSDPLRSVFYEDGTTLGK